MVHIREVLSASPLHGEGYRKAWARLRHAGIRTSRDRVRRLMRQHGLSAPDRPARRRGSKAHDGRITTDRPDAVWEYRRQAAPQPRGHCGDLHRHRPLHRRRESANTPPAVAPAMRPPEPLRRFVRVHYGSFDQDGAHGPTVRHDQGSQYMSHHIPGRAPIPRHPLHPGLRRRPRVQRRRRALHPDPQGATPVGPALPNRRGPPPRPPRVQATIQRILAHPEAPAPHARPGPCATPQAGRSRGPNRSRPASKNLGCTTHAPTRSEAQCQGQPIRQLGTARRPAPKRRRAARAPRAPRPGRALLPGAYFRPEGPNRGRRVRPAGHWQPRPNVVHMLSSAQSR